MNGFYPVLNEVHDKAIKELPLAECALFEHIWRKLIGWQKLDDDIAVSQLVKETASSKATIMRLLKKLEEKHWIRVDRPIGRPNHIAIPNCPGIKMRLGWYQNDTSGGIKMIPQPVSKRDTQQTGLTDTLQTTNNKPAASLKKKKPSRRDEVLPNGMTRGELLDLLEFKPAVISFGKEEHIDIIAYLSEQPRDRIEWSVEQTKAENGGRGIGATGALKWIYNGVDQYEYRTQGVKGSADTAAALESCRKYLAELEGAQLTLDRPEDYDEMIAVIKEDIERLEAENG